MNMNMNMNTATGFQAESGVRSVSPDICKEIKNADKLWNKTSRDNNKIEVAGTAVTEIEYGQLEILTEQFCRVPLVVEFRKPVIVLHPEVSLLFIMGRV